MQLFKMKPLRLWVTAAVGAISFAQSTLSAAQTVLEEIVVTATRRETNLQDTGLSITAFSGEQLRETNAVRFDDIAIQTPGLQYTQGGGQHSVIANGGRAHRGFSPATRWLD